jgi:hypothetical protein
VSSELRESIVNLLTKIAEGANADFIVLPPKGDDKSNLEYVSFPQRLDAAKVLIAGYSALVKADGKSPPPPDDKPGFDFGTARREKDTMEKEKGAVQ